MNDQHDDPQAIVLEGDQARVVLEAIFGSIRERKEATEKIEAIASDYLHPEQARLTWGSTYVAWPGRDIGKTGDEDYVAWGHMISRTLYVFGQTADGIPEDEIQRDVRTVQTDFLDRHVLPGNTYSVYNTSGVIAPISAYFVWPIPRLIFEAAEAVEFNPDRYSVSTMAHLILARIAYASHRKGTIGQVERRMAAAGVRGRV